MFDTEMMALAPQEFKDKLIANAQFSQHLGNPVDFAALLLRLIENPTINGETIRLDAIVRVTLCGCRRVKMVHGGGCLREVCVTQSLDAPAGF